MNIDHIVREATEGPPHIGAETEGIVSDRRTLEVVHLIKNEQPTEAVRRWIKANVTGGDQTIKSITPDIPETTAEANPHPQHSPRSAAASQRLMAILIDEALQDLSDGDFQLVNGASWSPSKTTEADASRHVALWKQIYYRFQIEQYGNSVAEATGDHLNLSLPWLDHKDSHEVSERMIRMTAKMRLIAASLSIALSASSPLYYSSNGPRREPTYGTALTQFDSARLGIIWPGRTIVDVPELSQSEASFRRTMSRFAATGVLRSGRDLWQPVRAQPGDIAPGKTFEETCTENGIDLETPEGKALAEKLLSASFKYGPNNPDNPNQTDEVWQNIEAWRQDMLSRIITAPRNRVELRTLETPPAFDDVTPYEYIKSLQTFFDLLFIYLSRNPDFVQDLEFDSITLAAAKDNESRVLKGGLDAEVRWIPNMSMTTPRAILQHLLEKLQELSEGFGNQEDLEAIRSVVSGAMKTPAARIREEVSKWYDINVDRHNPRLLHDDSYPRKVLQRNREAMTTEVDQIRADLSKMPPGDREYIANLLAQYDQIQQAKKSPKS